MFSLRFSQKFSRLFIVLLLTISIVLGLITISEFRTLNNYVIESDFEGKTELINQAIAEIEEKALLTSTLVSQLQTVEAAYEGPEQVINKQESKEEV